jgi:hypothetical protein
LKPHLLSQAIELGRRHVSRSVTFKAASLGLIALLVATQTSAQNRISGDFAGRDPVGTSSQQVAPAHEEANLVSPQRIPFLALEAGQDGGQSSSQTMPAAETGTKTTKAKATNTKPPHHALGVTLVVVGVAAVAAGAFAYGLGKTSICTNEQSGGCKEARDAGIALMPVGAGVAVAGFYFQFQH